MPQTVDLPAAVSRCSLAKAYGDCVILSEDVLLLLIDDASGKFVVDKTRLDLALAGGVLLDLATLGRVDVTGPGEPVKAGRLVVRDAGPTDDSVLDEALRRIGEMGPKKPESVVPKLAKGLRQDLLGRLISRGILRAQEGRVLGIFPSHSWPALDSGHERQVRSGLHDVLVAGRSPAPREAALVSLLQAIDQVAPDLVMLDQQIGNMGGMATCMAIRNEEGMGRIPITAVLMLLDRPADTFLARRADADGWVIKPMDSFRLRKAATTLLDGASYFEGVDPDSDLAEGAVIEA